MTNIDSKVQYQVPTLIWRSVVKCDSVFAKKQVYAGNDKELLCVDLGKS